MINYGKINDTLIEEDNKEFISDCYAFLTIVGLSTYLVLKKVFHFWG